MGALFQAQRAAAVVAHDSIGDLRRRTRRHGRLASLDRFHIGTAEGLQPADVTYSRTAHLHADVRARHLQLARHARVRHQRLRAAAGDDAQEDVIGSTNPRHRDAGRRVAPNRPLHCCAEDSGECVHPRRARQRRRSDAGSAGGADTTTTAIDRANQGGRRAAAFATRGGPLAARPSIAIKSSNASRVHIPDPQVRKVPRIVDKTGAHRIRDDVANDSWRGLVASQHSVVIALLPQPVSGPAARNRTPRVVLRGRRMGATRTGPSWLRQGDARGRA